MERFHLTIKSTAALLLTAMPVFAGGYVKQTETVPYTPPVAQPAAKFNWTGPYAGLSAGRTNLDLRRDLTTVTPNRVYHPAEYETVEVPAITREVVVPAVTEQVTIPAVTEPITEIQKVWVPADQSNIPPEHRGGCKDGGTLCPVPVEGTGEWNEYGWTGEWLHEAVQVGTRVIEPERTETVEIEPERVETVTVKPATTKRVKVKDALVEELPATITTTALALATDANTYGVFAGYRHQFSNGVVLGVEGAYSQGNVSASHAGVAYDFDLSTASIEAQLGYAMGRALPYIAAGYAVTDGSDAFTASIGLDYAITDNLIAGVKYTRAEYDDLAGWQADSDTVSVRIGWKF